MRRYSRIWQQTRYFTVGDRLDDRGFLQVKGGGGEEIRTPEGVAPNTLSNNADQRSPASATVREPREHDPGNHR